MESSGPPTAHPPDLPTPVGNPSPHPPPGISTATHSLEGEAGEDGRNLDAWLPICCRGSGCPAQPPTLASTARHLGRPRPPKCWTHTPPLYAQPSTWTGTSNPTARPRKNRRPPGRPRPHPGAGRTRPRSTPNRPPGPGRPTLPPALSRSAFIVDAHRPHPVADAISPAPASPRAPPKTLGTRPSHRREPLASGAITTSNLPPAD